MSHDGYYSESSSVENVNDLVNEAQLYRDQALAAATDADLSEAGANTSETNAGVSETNALAASVSAAASAGVASTSASNAGISANAAGLSETSASSSAYSALSSANAAAVSEANAFNSANAAATTLSNAALKSNNLSDLNSIPTAKVNLGIQNVDNTSDANKPVSTATQAALNLKAPLESPALTGVPTAPTASLGTNTTQLATTAFVIANSGGLGTGQTWQDMFGSRVANTTYTNTTGVPIQLAVYWNNAIINGLTIDGDNFFRAGSSSTEGNTLSPIIPAGSTYSASTGFGLWKELR